MNLKYDELKQEINSLITFIHRTSVNSTFHFFSNVFYFPRSLHSLPNTRHFKIEQITCHAQCSFVIRVSHWMTTFSSQISSWSFVVPSTFHLSTFTVIIYVRISRIILLLFYIFNFLGFVIATNRHFKIMLNGRQRRVRGVPFMFKKDPLQF